MVKLSSMGFKKGSDVEVKRRMLLSIEGLPGHGKTSFLLTAPKPLAVFEFDTGLDEAIANRFRHQEHSIFYREYSIPNFFEAAQVGTFDYLATWQRFLKEYKSVLESDAKSIGIDTGTEMYELQRMARFGKLTEVMPQHYGPVNAEFRELLRLAKDSGKNLILTHKLKNEYVSNKPTGSLIRAGFNSLGYDVHALTSIYREDGEFTLTINESKQNIGVVGMELGGEMCTFPFLASMVFPGTSLEDWE